MDYLNKMTETETKTAQALEAVTNQEQEQKKSEELSEVVDKLLTVVVQPFEEAPKK